jgi:Ca2+-binding RTX toxin-like protein
VDITVNPVNDLPIAINDTAETNEDQPLTIIPSDLLSNDSDIDGDRLTITQVNNSANGTVELSEDGNILFTPDSDFNGLASFEYTVTDGTDTTSATVEITVNQNRDRNIIEGTTQRDSLIGTDSNDIITGFQGADRITTGNGEDKLVYNSIVDAGDLITDFDPSNDIIDLQGVLQSIGFDGSNAIDDGYVQLVSYGSRGTSLQIDADGADGSAIFRPYLFLQGVSVAEINDNSNLTFG